MNPNRLVIVAVILLAGCARQPLTAPSPTAVQGGLSQIKTSATTAEQQRQESLALNREARIKQARVDNKDAVIEGYRKWKAGQKP